MPDPKLKPKPRRRRRRRQASRQVGGAQADDGTGGEGRDARVEHGRGADPVRRADHAGGRRRRRRDSSTSVISAAPSTSPDDRADHGELEPESGRGGAGDGQVHDPAGRHAHERRSREEQPATPLLDLESRRAMLKTQQLPPLPARVHRTDADRPSHFRLHALMTPIRPAHIRPCRLRRAGADGSDAAAQPRRRSSHGSPARLS